MASLFRLLCKLCVHLQFTYKSYTIAEIMRPLDNINYNNNIFWLLHYIPITYLPNLRSRDDYNKNSTLEIRNSCYDCFMENCPCRNPDADFFHSQIL